MQTFFHDLRYALRMLRRSPGFTAVAVLTLALGIGANTAIFSVVHAVLWRSLPYRDPDRLLIIWGRKTPEGLRNIETSPPDLLDWRQQNRVFTQVEAFGGGVFILGGLAAQPGEPERVAGEHVTGGFFGALGAEAALGRTFLPEEDQKRVVVLSHRLWQRRFYGDPKLLGQSVILNGSNYTVIGIMPPEFRFYRRDVELWIPLALAGQPYSVRHNRFLSVFARLKPGVSLEQARAEMEVITSRLEQQYPDTNAGFHATLVPLKKQYFGEIRPALLVLLGAVGFVLLIACANMANLLLARAAARQKEIAVRMALGAGRRRLVRQLLTETCLLACLGGAAGLLLGFWSTGFLISLIPQRVQMPIPAQIGSPASLDPAVLGFTLAVSLLTGLLFGLAPALRSSKCDLHATLKEAASSGPRGAVSRIFIVSEVALSLVLLIGAGLMIRSFLRLQGVDPGFRPEKLLTMRIMFPIIPERGTWNWTAVGAFYEQALERVRALPGVRSAALTKALPFTGSYLEPLTIEGRPAPAAGREPTVDFRMISPDYLRTMGIPARKGRDFTTRDRRDAPLVAIINEALARRHFPNEDPLGKRLRRGSAKLTIVGVVGDVRHGGLEAEPEPEMYVPLLQEPDPVLSLVVRSDLEPGPLATAIKRELWTIEKEVVVYDISAMEQIISDSVWQPRLNTLLLGSFAILAVLLAGVGIYGVVSDSVAQRTREIGIRVALGAEPRDVLAMVIRQGLGMVAAGTALGILAAFWLTRLLSNLLYGVTATDPATFAGMSALLVAVAVAACYIPARRATKVDPMVALRYE